MKKKAFDCVEMMHRGARRIYEETKNMNRTEELAYWLKKNEKLPKQSPERASSLQ